MFCGIFTNDNCTCSYYSVVVGMIDTAIGKAQLLMSQKFAQFRQLCDLAKVRYGTSY